MPEGQTEKPFEATKDFWSKGNPTNGKPTIYKDLRMTQGQCLMLLPDDAKILDLLEGGALKLHGAPDPEPKKAPAAGKPDEKTQRAELEELTFAEVYQLAKDEGAEVKARMHKAEMIDAILAHRAG